MEGGRAVRDGGREEGGVLMENMEGMVGWLQVAGFSILGTDRTKSGVGDRGWDADDVKPGE